MAKITLAIVLACGYYRDSTAALLGGSHADDEAEQSASA
jgi:hypothetical protein